MIVIIDDNKDIADYIFNILKNYEDASVFTDVDEFLYFFNENRKKIDVVLMDYKMPKMNGSELASKVKFINKKCKIIIFTAYLLENEQWAPADMYIRKPISKDYLLRNVGEIMGKFLKKRAA